MRIGTLFAILAWCCLGSDGEAADAPRPNVLLIMADDLGFSDLACYGSEIKTPQLDALANNGLRYSQFYNTGRCWPTRGSLLTGYYAQQVRRDSLPGIPSGNAGQRPGWAPLLPELLKPAGYRSYHVGKWHVDGMPLEGGFDRSYYLRDQGRFFNPTKHWLDDKPLNAVEKDSGYYATRELADRAIQFLAEHEQRHSGRPFFQYLAFSAPHFPLHAIPEDIEQYSQSYRSGWDLIRSSRWRRMQQLGLLDSTAVSKPSRVERDVGPPYHFPEAFQILGDGELNRPRAWNQLTESQREFQERKMAIHAAMIHRMDIEIGRVLEQIKKMGQWENTLVLFLSDNGASAEIMVRDDGHDSSLSPGAAGTYLCLGPGWSTVSNTPFRRHKTWTHEGGVSTPLIASWPNGIVERGSVRRSPGHVIDVVPTILDLAGVADSSDVTRPGVSLVESFGHAVGRDRKLWWFHDGHKAVRIGDWKAVAPIGEPWELYDLAVDRAEEIDLAVALPNKLTELTQWWTEQRDEYIGLVSTDLSAELLAKASQRAKRSSNMTTAQAAALPKRQQVLLNGQSFMVKGRHAFIMEPNDQNFVDDLRGPVAGRPWVFYAPTLKGLPDKSESWLHQQLLDAGVAIAGIDVGEAYGSPTSLQFFDALHQEMTRRGFSAKPALLGRSRGGLWVSSWAIHKPEQVAGIAGIYPVYDLTSYPGVEKAAVAFALSDSEMTARLDSLNPINNVAKLAQARIPVCIIHGTDDRVVPIETNSDALVRAYAQKNASEMVELIRVDGQGHNFWEGFFRNERVVKFLIERAMAGAIGE